MHIKHYTMKHNTTHYTKIKECNTTQFNITTRRHTTQQHDITWYHFNLLALFNHYARLYTAGGKLSDLHSHFLRYWVFFVVFFLLLIKAAALTRLTQLSCKTQLNCRGLCKNSAPNKHSVITFINFFFNDFKFAEYKSSSNWSLTGTRVLESLKKIKARTVLLFFCIFFYATIQSWQDFNVWCKIVPVWSHSHWVEPHGLFFLTASLPTNKRENSPLLNSYIYLFHPWSFPDQLFAVEAISSLLFCNFCFTQECRYKKRTSCGYWVFSCIPHTQCSRDKLQTYSDHDLEKAEVRERNMF